MFHVEHHWVKRRWCPGGVMAAKIIAVANQKGGVGKTTTAVNISACVAAANYETLLIDIDPQANASAGLGINKSGPSEGIYQIFMSNKGIKPLIRSTSVRHLSIVPSSIELIGAEVELVDVDGRERILKEALEDVRPLYRFIFIDCPPSLGILTLNSLAAADSVLIPLQCEYYALEGLVQLLKTVNLVRHSINHSITIEGILLTMYDSRTTLSAQVASEVQRLFGSQVFGTIVPRNVRLSEAPSHGIPIILYDMNCKGAEAYMNAAKEIISNAKKSLG